jgi:hypothetical protein
MALLCARSSVVVVMMVGVVSSLSDLVRCWWWSCEHICHERGVILKTHVHIHVGWQNSGVKF